MAGSIVKRGEVYYIRYEAPKGIDGKRRQKMIACRGMNKRQAEQKLRDILTQIHAGAYANSGDMTLTAYFKKWMDEHESARISPVTAGNYQQYLDAHILPHLGHIKLSALRPLHLTEFYKSLLDSGKSAKSVKNYHGVIRTALKQAVRWQLISYNPADNVDPPTVTKKEARSGRPEQLAVLLDAITDSPYRVPILLALATGMRRGEVLALKWEDYDPARRVLIVRRALSRMRGGGYVIGPPKSKKTRVVKLPWTLVLELNELPRREGIDWIHCREDGYPITPSALTNAFSRLAQSLKIDISFHGLRHSQATALLASGVPAKIVSERLGHSTIVITNDIYGHVLPDDQDEAVEVIESILQGAKTAVSKILDSQKKKESTDQPCAECVQTDL